MVGNQESSTASNFEMYPLVHSSTAAASGISGDTQIGHSNGDRYFNDFEFKSEINNSKNSLNCNINSLIFNNFIDF